MKNKIIFLNENYIPYDEAFVHIEDRGFQLGDGIYEVILFQNNRLVDFDEHIDRLFRSAQEINLKINKSKENFKDIALTLFEKNNLESGSIYIQATRGKNKRIQNFPKDYESTINAIANPMKNLDEDSIKSGFKAITHEDIRWDRCDIKSISLLGSTMLKEKAENNNAVEAILIKDGFVTEGSFSNVFIVDSNNNLVTRASDNQILTGITRNSIIKLAKTEKIGVIEKKFTEIELINAKEVFVTSSTLKIRPITRINENQIGSGRTGEITSKLIKIYNNYCK